MNTPFPGLSELTQKINGLVEHLNVFDETIIPTYLDNLNLGKMISKDEFKNNYELMKNIESVVDELRKLNYNYDLIFQKRRTIVDQIYNFKFSTRKLLKNANEELVNIMGTMENHKDNLSVLQTSREKAKTLDELVWGSKQYEGVLAIAEEPVTSAIWDLKKYHEGQKKIDVLSDKIEEIKSRYSDFYKSLDPQSDLKQIKKEIKDGLIKSELVKDCNDTKYYEGNLIIKKLNMEIDWISNHVGEVLNQKSIIDSKTEDLIKRYKKVESFNKIGPLEIEFLKDTKASLINVNDYKHGFIFLEKPINELNKIKSSLDEIVAYMLNESKGIMKEYQNANFWNNKWTISNNVKYKSVPATNDVVYKARDKKLWDVRDFITSNNIIVKKIVEDNNLNKGTLDEIAYNCMTWVQKNLHYKSDPQVTNNPEEWLFPTETVQQMKGDCEDGTNLMVSLMRNAGIPSYRVKNACGEVPEGGHSWTLYLREKDDQWISLDWSYKPSPKSIEKRIPAKDNKDYKKIWFTFNDENSWSESNYTISNHSIRKEEIISFPLKTYVPNTNNTRFILQEALSKINLPSHDYEVLDEIVNHRVPCNGWVERMEKIGQKSKELINKASKSKYPYELYSVLSDFKEKGYLGSVANQSESNKNKINNSLKNLYELALQALPA